MGIKFVLAFLMLLTVFTERLEAIRGSDNNCDIKEYINEVFVNMSRCLGCKNESNGTKLATKDDILQIKNACIIEHKPIDCEDIQNNGYNTTGVYTIYLKRGTSAISVRCDMDTSYGGWIVIQRRVSNSDFYKPWSEYEAGFGTLNDNFWLGLRNIHLITKRAKYELRVDLSSMNGETAYAYYDEFSIGGAESSYKLNVAGYSGTAGDGLTYHNSMKFSTYDLDNDLYSANCGVLYHGAWWYRSCHFSNLNGDYGNTDYAKGPVWKQWKGYYSPMKITEMKIRQIG